jgi:membrane protease YdiL (CAAX protease family)
MGRHIYNARYKEEVAKYGKKDAIIALCYIVFLSIALPLVFGTLSPWMRSLPITGELRITILSFLFLVPCFAAILIKRQGFSSIGIHTKNLLPALCLGIVFSTFSLVFTYRGILPGLLTGEQFQTFGILMALLFSTVINAAWEDIAITGYVQTRLYGLIKNDVLCVLVGGLLFAWIHIPPRIYFHGLSAFDAYLLVEVVGWIGMHVIFNWVFRRYFSIFPVILLHTFINFAGGNLWYMPLPLGVNHTIISFLVTVLVVGAWALYLNRKGNKLSAEK